MVGMTKNGIQGKNEVRNRKTKNSFYVKNAMVFYHLWISTTKKKSLYNRYVGKPKRLKNTRTYHQKLEFHRNGKPQKLMEGPKNPSKIPGQPSLSRNRVTENSLHKFHPVRRNYRTRMPPDGFCIKFFADQN